MSARPHPGYPGYPGQSRKIPDQDLIERKCFVSFMRVLCPLRLPEGSGVDGRALSVSRVYET